MMTTVTREEAEAVLAAVRQQNIDYLTPLTMDDGTVYPPCCSEPTLVEDYDGAPAIVWEEGPDDWAYRVNEGGRTETERVLLHQAAAEFGATVPASSGPAPATLPPGVYVEPYFSFVLSIYPA